MVADSMAMASPPQLATSERDLRLDLFRGLALWLIFLDHIPQNIVNWITIRNYGFSDATEIFIFISGYTAAFVYGRKMRALANLRRSHFSVHDLHGGDRLCRGHVRKSALCRGNENPRFSQTAGHHHLSGAAVEIQARQHGRAAALHRVVAVISADAVFLAAPPQCRAWRLGAGLCVCLAARL